MVEVVVVDDGSTDCSAAVMARYGDRIVSVYKPNGGQDSSFNAGFEHCHGDIICLLDADDRFAPDKLSKIAACFAQYPDIGWCFHSMVLEDLRTGRMIGTTRAFPDAAYDRSQHCDFREHLRFGQLPFYLTATSGLCFRRSLLAQLLPMPETFINTSADRYLRVAAVGVAPGYFLAEALTTQGIHDSNVSTLRPDRPSIPERQIVVAYLLRTKFPELTPYADRLFSRGLTAYKSLMRRSRRAGGPAPLSPSVELAYLAVIRDYWQLCSLLEHAVIALACWYRQRPWRSEHSPDAYYYPPGPRQLVPTKTRPMVVGAGSRGARS